MAGIYIHIPFCKRKCIYCDFYSTAQFEKYSASYLDAVIRELHFTKDYLGADPVNTLYFGGGTPSLYSPAGIGKMIEAVKNIYGTEGITEITLEANPEDITPEYLSGLHEAGINRLSIGIQSFDDGLLGYMKRRHDGTKALFSVHAARRAGFDNISIDLLYGIPSLTSKLWEETLDRALALEPEHISAYHLTIEPATLLGRQHSAGKVTEIPQQESQEQFLILREKLVTSGYEHYEVSNFAKPSFRSRHNSSYWTGEKYLGIGPGAHSFDGMERRWCSMTVSEYIAAPRIVYHWETLTPNDIYNELVMTSLRCADGLTAAKISDRAGEKYTSYFTSRADGLLQRGLLQLEADRYFIHPRDFLISDNIISSLFI